MNRYIFTFGSTGATYIVESTDFETAERKLVEHLHKEHHNCTYDDIAEDLNHDQVLENHGSGICEIA